MNEEVEISDLKNIIQDLISFIVVDGKQYVSKKKQDAYVMKYVQCFIEAINEAPKKDRNPKILGIMKDIANDVNKIGPV